MRLSHDYSKYRHFWQGCNWKPLIWLSLIFVLLYGCIEEIDLDGSGQGVGKMVIQGQLLKGCPSKVTVLVSRSSDFKSRELPPAISGAVVLIRDSNGNELLIPELEAGLYRMEIDEFDALTLEPGEKYILTVNTGDGGMYVSTWESLQGVPQADSISIELVEREELDFNNVRQTKRYVQFFVHTPLVSVNQLERAFLMWSFNTVYQVTEPCLGPGCNPQTCYVSRNLGLDNVVVFNGNEANTNRLDHFMLAEDEAEARFGLGYLLTVKQHSLSREAYQYWNQVSETVSLSGGLFEVTPGKIVGNMSNVVDSEEEVFGYFYASEEFEINRFVKPSEAGRPKSFCDRGQNTFEENCTDCTTIPFSTKERPDHWEF